MAPLAEGEGMMEEPRTFSLAEAMVVAQKKSKLDKRRARHKQYYDSPLMRCRRKNSAYYQKYQDTIRVRSRVSYQRKKMNTVVEFMLYGQKYADYTKFNNFEPQLSKKIHRLYYHQLRADDPRKHFPQIGTGHSLEKH